MHFRGQAVDSGLREAHARRNLEGQNRLASSRRPDFDAGHDVKHQVWIECSLDAVVVEEEARGWLLLPALSKGQRLEAGPDIQKRPVLAMRYLAYQHLLRGLWIVGHIEITRLLTVQG